ncbi:MAG: 3-phosphoserine/phosphohydroxythreonine transaminase [Planctomycetota bacterium]|nr:3-phosphoserine/phosphohydroxythreonine transaminase [Planctomycetaceae bacterium]MDQ3330645.1 3-phosphoserine/phosphohydroxythreonine transaminase [Planctomycetota bacterium]
MPAAANRVFNFSAGPATMPVPVLEETREALLSLGDSGIGVLEHSHRGKAFLKEYQEAVSLIREVGGVPDDYEVLFLQGGASLQFAMVPMNYLAKDATADYLVTGSWSEKAVKEAKLFGNVHSVCSSKDKNFNYIPTERKYSDKPAYVHFTSNNTIFGTQFQTEPETPGDAFLVCDASSDIFSRPLDVSKRGIVYAGAQKNLGPSGVTLVLIRKDLIGRGKGDLSAMLKYSTFAENESMYNTPPTFGIYVVKLVVKWIKEQGGLKAMHERNLAKATKLYKYLDHSQLFKATVTDPNSRSLMNVTFVTGDDEQDAKFIKFATGKGLDGLKGHRSVGGMRASIYNAFPQEGVDVLVAAMREFEANA